VFAEDEVNQQEDPDDRHQEREEQHHDELLRGLDERGMFDFEFGVVRVIHTDGC